MTIYQYSHVAKNGDNTSTNDLRESQEESQSGTANNLRWQRLSSNIFLLVHIDNCRQRSKDPQNIRPGRVVSQALETQKVLQICHVWPYIKSLWAGPDGQELIEVWQKNKWWLV
jgi:hypothetical protein